MSINPQQKQPRFVSMRWRLIMPVFVIVLIVASVGAYVLTDNVSSGLDISQENLLLQSSRAIINRNAQLATRHFREAQRVAFTEGVPEAVSTEQNPRLESLLEGLARAGELDSVIVTDAQGVEVMGLLRVGLAQDYAISQGTSLADDTLVRSILQDGQTTAAGFVRTAEGILLYTAVPISQNDTPVGVALVGQRLNRILEELKGSSIADVTLYGAEGALLQTTFNLENSPESLALPPEIFDQALTAQDQMPLQSLVIDGQNLQATYQPFTYGAATLGVIAAMMPDNVPATTQVERQLTGLVASALAASVVVIVFVGATLAVERANRVRKVAEALASGDRSARTGLKASDEIGAVGRALDRYADVSQQREDALYTTLRRQRREYTHLMSVFESLPDGVIVQDLDGRVVLMNERAKTLLGSQRVFRSSNLHELTAVVTDTLGASIAPGLYALGDPQRVDLDERMLSAQAAAILSMTRNRVGTVIVLRDITEQVQRERAQEALLRQLEQSVQEPIAQIAQAGAQYDHQPVQAFANQIAKHSVVLQKLIVEMRELTDINLRKLKQGQRPILLDTLVWSVANDWRQVALAANLNLQVIIEAHGLYVLGDERRLRWAIGNLVDNAIKYTLPGGQFSLEIRGETEDGFADLRIRDTGVGIAKEDREHIFTRFYRGNPVTPAGLAIRTPGMGQGLTVAKQIIEAHGGTIRVQTRLGVGTAVSFTLPLTSGESMELPRLPIETADMDGETYRLDFDEQQHTER